MRSTSIANPDRSLDTVNFDPQTIAQATAIYDALSQSPDYEPMTNATILAVKLPMPPGYEIADGPVFERGGVTHCCKTLKTPSEISLESIVANGSEVARLAAEASGFKYLLEIVVARTPVLGFVPKKFYARVRGC